MFTEWRVSVLTLVHWVLVPQGGVEKRGESSVARGSSTMNSFNKKDQKSESNKKLE